MSSHLEEKVTFMNSKGDKLKGVLYNPSGDKTKPIILFVHGHSSSKYTKNFVRLTEMLNDKGISSFRIDLYGHGESKGKFEDCTVSEACDDILQAIEFLKKQGYSKIGLLGSSFGGISSIMAASKSRDLFLLVLKSPVCNYEEKYLETNGKEFIEEWKQKGVREYSKEKGLKLYYSFYEDGLINDGYKAAPNIKVPTLIVHGDKDEAVPVGQSIKISKLIPDCKLEIVKGSDHVYTLPEHRDQILKAVSKFIFDKSDNK